jgi:hypothetical protein
MTSTSTRAERMAMPLARDSIRKIVEASGGCLRPVQLRRTDTVTGAVEQVMIPCGATLASICPPCAERAKMLRATQCRAGWHLEDEPDPGPPAPDETQAHWLLLRAEAQVRRDRAEARSEDTDELDELIGELDTEITRAGIRGSLPAIRAAAKTVEGEGQKIAVHSPPPRRPATAQAEGRPADGRPCVHHPGRQELPALDVPHPYLR